MYALSLAQYLDTYNKPYKYARYPRTRKLLSPRYSTKPLVTDTQ